MGWWVSLGNCRALAMAVVLGGCVSLPAGAASSPAVCMAPAVQAQYRADRLDAMIELAASGQTATERALAAYHAGARLLDKRESARARQLLERAREELEPAWAKQGDVESAIPLHLVYSQLLRAQPWRGATIGRVADGLLETAKKRHGGEPGIVLIDALATAYKPALFGGDVAAGLRELQRAVDLFHRRADGAGCWGADQAAIALAMLQAQQGDVQSALAGLRAWQTRDPEHALVRRTLAELGER